jgi:hypothetical protein
MFPRKRGDEWVSALRNQRERESSRVQERVQEFKREFKSSRVQERVQEFKREESDLTERLTS